MSNTKEFNNRIRAFTGLERATDKFKGRRGLARKLQSRGVEITPQAVNGWKRVPLKWVPLVSEISGVPRYELCPEIPKS